MKLLNAQKEILTALNKNPKSVHVLDHGPDGNPVVIVHGCLGYVIPEDELWIDLEKVEHHSIYTDFVRVRELPENQLTVTNKLEQTELGLLRLAEHTDDIFGEHDDVWLQDGLLKNFTLPNLYQEKGKPKGLILITENTTAKGEHIVGIMLPVSHNKED